MTGVIWQQLRPGKHNIMPEFVLKAPSADYKDRYHVAKLNVSQFDVSQAGLPLQLYRGDPSEQKRQVEDINDQKSTDGAVTEENADGEAAEKKRKFRRSRKSKVYYATRAYEDTRKLRRRHHFPWLLEDSEGFINFEGNIDGSQKANYVLFVNNGNDGFTVVPVSEWYKFQPRITYRTLTTDEAEEHMSSKDVSMDRWMMHRQREKEMEQARAKLKVSLGESKSENKADDAMEKMENMDDFAVKEQFEDDEEYMEGEEEGYESESEMQRRLNNGLFGEDFQDSSEDEDEEARRIKDQIKKEEDETSKLVKKIGNQENGESVDEQDVSGEFDGDEVENVSDTDIYGDEL